jgi:hypothetical protein
MNMDRITKSDATEPGRHTPERPSKRQAVPGGTGPKGVEVKVANRADGSATTSPSKTGRRATDH